MFKNKNHLFGCNNKYSAHLQTGPHSVKPDLKKGLTPSWRSFTSLHTGKRESHSQGQRIQFDFSSTCNSQSKPMCAPRWSGSPASLVCCYSLLQIGFRASSKLATPSPPLIFCAKEGLAGMFSMQVAVGLAAMQLGRTWLTDLAHRLPL